MTIIDDALPYRRRGFSVIPIKPRDKKPLVSWEPYQKEPASEGTINHWFQSWPNANLGIVTGAVSDTVVIDLDSQEAKEKIKSLLPNYGLGSVPRVRTGRGGYHLFFKHPGSVVETRTGVLPKTDVRGDGGLVVAAPSIHENGKRYAWEVPLSGALPDLPPELLELISKPSINGNGTHKHFDPSTVWEGIPEGQRDETLFKYACQMRHNNAPRELAERLILEAAARCKPPFPEADALKKLDQAWRYNPGHSAAESNNAKSIQAAITEAIFIKMADVTPKKLHWLWQGRIPLGKVTVLDGDPGLGKSLISVDLAGYLTTGRPMPNMAVADIAEPAGAVFLSAEDDVEDTIQPRLNIAGADLNRVVYLKAVKRNGEIWMPSITDLDAMKEQPGQLMPS